MRILYVCSDRGVPVFGTKGASVHVCGLAAALVRLGHEVLVVAANAGGGRPRGFAPTVVELPPGEAAVGSAGELATAFGADLVYERLSLFGTVGSHVARLLGVPLLVEVNAPLAEEALAHRGLVRPGAARAVERSVLRGADTVLAVSTELRRWSLAQGVDPGRIAVVPNAVDDTPPGLSSRAEARRRLGLDPAPAVGFLGTLKPWHDVAGLLRACALLTRAGRELEIVLVGDGPQRAALARLAREEGLAGRTRFLGAVAHEQVPGLLRALDIGVVPYARRDGVYFSPLKLFEYLAAGVPVVAADAGDVRHCVGPGRSGLLYEPGDAESLAGALADLLDDPRSAAVLGARGREHVLRSHTWDANAHAVLALASRRREARAA